jgi:hypothetical protein
LIHTVGNSPRNALGQIDWRGLIFPDANPLKILRMGTLFGIWHPLFLPALHDRKITGHGFGCRDRRASYGLRWQWIVPSISESPFWKGGAVWVTGQGGDEEAEAIENGEASTLFREHLEVRLDENLDGLLAGIDLDTNGGVAEVNLVALPVLTSNDG